MAGDETPDHGGAEAATGPRTTGGGSGRGTGGEGSGAVAVDPRMRQRRIGVRREAGRRRLRRVTAALAVAAALVGAAVATRTPLLDVDRVTVRGASGADQDEVRRRAGVAHGDPLVAVDPDAVARRVEQLPWVARARVRRAWPSGVEVEVSRRVPVAIVPVTDTNAAVVDAGGWVISIEPFDVAAVEGEAEPGGLALVTGVDGEVAEGARLDAPARAAIDVARTLAERAPGQVASVSTDLEAELVAGGAVQFGSTEDLQAKVTAVKTVLDEVDTSCLEVLDVRVPGSPALTRNQRCP